MLHSTFCSTCIICLMILIAASGNNLRGNTHRKRKAREDTFDWATANATVSLSALAYCGNATIMSGNYNGSITVADFSPVKIIYNKYYDVNGFIGISDINRAIYVIFRGSMTITNWLDDFDTLMTNYPYCASCSVHAGFYYSAQSVKDDVVYAVQALHKTYPNYEVIVGGHSLGAALATLTAVNLFHNDISNLRHFSYGSPRLGNAAAAAYISNLLPEIVRTTHYKDIVPHNPFTHFGYVHVSGEWYETEKGMLGICMGFEDVHCADQWTFEENIADHMRYLGRSMWCTIGHTEV